MSAQPGVKATRRGKPVQPRTVAMCARFRARKAAGHEERMIISDLSNEFSIQRAAVWKALRSGGAVEPYRPRDDATPRRPGGGDPDERQARISDGRSLDRARIEKARPAPAEPCPRCNVRADVGCRHQLASGLPPPAIEHPERKDDKRFRRPGLTTGLAFHPERKTAESVRRAGEHLTRLNRHDDLP